MWFVEDYCFGGEHSRHTYVYTVQDLDHHLLMSWFDHVFEVLTAMSRIVLICFEGISIK